MLEIETTQVLLAFDDRSREVLFFDSLRAAIYCENEDIAEADLNVSPVTMG
jgi:hypothetical protein